MSPACWSSFEGRGRLDHLVTGSRFHLLGTSGTVTTLAGVHLGLERYDRRRVDGLWMDNANVDAMMAKLLSLGFRGARRQSLHRRRPRRSGARRLRHPRGDPRASGRASGCRVADRGLREGILSELMGEEGVWRSGWRGGARR